jgi:ABC-type transport system involved in multi-copper enzyme maturation permease subunit
MLRQTGHIAFYTVLEALRNRLGWLLLAVALAALGLGAFLDSLAMTESRQIQAALLGALARMAAVFLLATFVVTSMVREIHDKGLELLLALPLTRAAYLFGKLLGFGAVALAPALLFGALMLRYAAAPQAALWGASLWCELWIVAGFALVCVLTLRSMLAALSASMAFYLGARSIAAVQMMAQVPLAPPAPSQRAADALLDVVSAVLPRLDQFTQSSWLVYGDGSAGALASIAAQTVICMGLLAGVALFDFYRKNL